MKRETPKRHSIQARVYYEDTDAGGIVYHAKYLHFAERGRTEFLRALGYDHARTRADHAMHWVVSRLGIVYRAPAKLDDLLDVETEVASCTATRLGLKQVIRRADKVVAELDVEIVALGLSGRPVRIPPQLRQIWGG